MGKDKNDYVLHAKKCREQKFNVVQNVFHFVLLFSVATSLLSSFKPENASSMRMYGTNCLSIKHLISYFTHIDNLAEHYGHV